LIFPKEDHLSFGTLKGIAAVLEAHLKQ
jgi:hypothetical protein